MKRTKKQHTKIDYTLEHLMREQKRNEDIIEVLEKESCVLEKFEAKMILYDLEFKSLEKRIEKLEKTKK